MAGIRSLGKQMRPVTVPRPGVGVGVAGKGVEVGVDANMVAWADRRAFSVARAATVAVAA